MNLALTTDSERARGMSHAPSARAFSVRAFAALVALAFGTRVLAAQGAAPAVETDSIITTHHTIRINGAALSYTARAGVLPIRDNEDGSVRATMFFVAYIADRAPGAPARPLTFAWNGGPGANSLLLHLDAFGPRRFDGDSLVDNAQSLLSQSDVVFVDPVGTGFSRAARPQDAAAFYGVREDIAATREFIRVYRTHFDAWDAPLYLMGESYGSWRAMGTAQAMEENREHVAGVVLISGGLPVGPLVSRELRAALFLPTRVLTAAYHHKLSAALSADVATTAREAEHWGRTVYAPSLARRGSLTTARREEIVAGLARYTGLDPSVIDHKTLVVDRRVLLQNLVKERGALGTFDTRVAQGASPGAANALVAQPASAVAAARDSARRVVTANYLRHELGFAAKLAYLGLEPDQSAGAADPNADWQWDQWPAGTKLEMVDDGPPGGAPPWTQRALSLNRTIRVFVALGHYDSLNSCPLVAEQISRLVANQRSRITLGCYDGGHMMYEDSPARARLAADLARFYR